MSLIMMAAQWHVIVMRTVIDPVMGNGQFLRLFLLSKTAAAAETQ